MNGSELLSADDETFTEYWRNMTDDERAALSANERAACVNRYNRLTPWFHKSIARAERSIIVPGAGMASDPNIDGAQLLNDIYGFFGRFIAFPSEAAHVACTLWAVHTHCMDAWESTPRIAFLSPEKSSGKTRVREIMETLVPRPIASVNATPAYIFRKVSDPAGLPTLLYDEIDTFFGPRANEHEELRGMLNAGHRRGATSGRCVTLGRTIETVEFPAYCAVAFFGHGTLPDTLIERAIPIPMRKRAPGEYVEPYRQRDTAPEGHALRDLTAKWAVQMSDALRRARPAMPQGIADRNADVWEPLLAIADAAGGEWPIRARVAAVALVALSAVSTPSDGVRLLSDVRAVFGELNAMFSADLIGGLLSIDESPWTDLHGKPLDATRLAKMIKPYGVCSKSVRVGNLSKRGYAREDFHDAWARYLPAVPATATTELPNLASASSPRVIAPGRAADDGVII